MQIKADRMEYAVCSLDIMPDFSGLQGPFFLAGTDEEISLVCSAAAIPPGARETERGWNALKVIGPLDLAMVGILANIASILAEEDISIFAASTYLTDYILVKEDHLEQALAALAAKGYEIL